MRRIAAVEHGGLDGVMQSPSGLDEDRRDGFVNGGWAQAGNDDLMSAGPQSRLRPAKSVVTTTGVVIGTDEAVRDE